MRINELLIEDSQLDELTARGVGQGIGKVAGNVVRGTKDFFSGIKQGYQQGRADPQQQAQGGTAPGSAQSTPAASASGSAAPAQQAAPAQSTASPAPAQQTSTPSGTTAASPAPAQPATPTVTVSQINKAIPSLRTRDLQSVKKNVDATIAKKSGGRPAPAQPANRAPNLQVQPGGRPAQPAAPVQLPPLPAGTTIPAVESKFYSKFLDMAI